METHGRITLWDGTTPEVDHAAPLDGDTSCDLAVVGGGITGLSAALHAASRGIDTLVLEARGIGHGGSGRNVGLVNAGLWLPPQVVRRKLGDKVGGRLIGVMGEMPDYVFELIERHQIRCEPMRSGTIHAAHAPAGFRDLRGRAEAWQALGAPVELLDERETADLTGTRAFHGGLLDRRAGTINPMGYTRGLARAALGAGARIATGVTAQRLSQEGEGWLVHTAEGVVRARWVVLGTNAYTDALWPGLRASLTPVQFFQLATEPLGDRAAGILPGGQGLWDTATVMFSLRRDREGRLVIGSIGPLRPGLSERWARRRLARLFPDLGPVRFESAWEGEIAMTPDHVFRIHQPEPGLYIPTGYNGRGITTGTMFGRALADVLSGADPDALPIPVTPLSADPLRGIKAGLYRAAFLANQLLR